MFATFISVYACECVIYEWYYNFAEQRMPSDFIRASIAPSWSCRGWTGFVMDVVSIVIISFISRADIEDTISYQIRLVGFYVDFYFVGCCRLL